MQITSACIVHIKINLHLNSIQGWISCVSQSINAKLKREIVKVSSFKLFSKLLKYYWAAILLTAVSMYVHVGIQYPSASEYAV